MVSKQNLNWFFDNLEEWIRAVITDANSIHVEDSVRLTEIRKGLIAALLDGTFD